MEIRLYKNFVKGADSTKQPTGNYVTKQVQLKEETSVISPTFLLSDYDEAYNYVYVPAWGRYYFKNDCVLNINHMFELSLTFDHLATYKSSIGAYTCFVERCADSRYYNTQVLDPLIAPTEVFSVVASNEVELWGGGGVYVCRIMNKEYGVTTYIGTQTSFKGLFNPAAQFTDVDNAIESICNYYLCDPNNYVLDYYFLNIPLSVLEASGKLNAGEHVISGWFYSADSTAKRWTGSNYLIHNNNDPITITKPEGGYNDYRENSDSFTKYTIWIPSVGEMSVSADAFENPLKLIYCADIQSGDVTFILYNEVDSKRVHVASYHGNVKSGSQSGSVIPSLGSLLSGVSGFATAVATGNPVAIGLSTFNTVSSVIQPTPSIVGGVGSNTSIALKDEIVVSKYVRGTCDAPVTVAGRPCHKNLLLGNLRGFIQCAGANINNIAGTIEDKRLINASLNGGFYYE